MNKAHYAFTLAEVLITLVIIGVVAAMTIPSLMQNSNQAELKTAWKKSYSEYANIINQLVYENGGNLKGAFDSVGKTDDAASENLKNAFAEKLSVTKNCSGTATYGGTGSGAGVEGCWHSSFYFLNGTLSSGGNNPGLVLNNGAIVRFQIEKSDCSKDLSSSGADFTRCGWVNVDINGFKKPNMWGKDIFTMSILEKGVIPSGARGLSDPSITCVEGSTAGTNTGYGCSAKYLKE